MTNEKKLLTALIEEPSRYSITVLDGTMLPEKLQKKKSLDFVIKPPALETLTKAARDLQDVPEEILKAETLGFIEALPYVETMVKVICRLVQGPRDDYPDWYEPFFMANVTPQETFLLFQEVSLKMQTDFFLTSFQIAAKLNPLMMHEPKKKSLNDLIRTS
jgi:hypothetical protein